MVVVLPNNVNVADVENTALHEVVGHKGLRNLIDEERFDEFLDEVHEHAGNAIRKEIDKLEQKMVEAEVKRLEEEYADEGLLGKAKARAEAEQEREHLRREATEEYMADMAGRIGEEGFEKMSVEELTFWGKIKERVMKFLNKFLEGLKIPNSIKLTDKDIAYILYKSWKNMKNGGKPSIIEMAEDVVMREKAGYNQRVDEKQMFRDGDMGLDETISSMKAEIASKNADNVSARIDAMNAIGGNLGKLRAAMYQQKKYDIDTAKAMTDLAQTLIDNGLLDNMSKFQMNRILSTVRDAVGKDDFSPEVDHMMDIMVENQLRQGEMMLGRLLSTKGTKLNSNGVQVKCELDPEGDATLKAIKEYNQLGEAEIEKLMGELTSQLTDDNPVIAADAAIHYRAAQVSQRYIKEIKGSKAEKAVLSKELKDAELRMREDLRKMAEGLGIDLTRKVKHQEADADGNVTEVEKEVKRGPKELLKAIKDAGGDEMKAKQYLDAVDELRKQHKQLDWQNRIARIESYASIAQELGGILGASAERAKTWVEEEQKRVGRIHHLANSDMQGRKLQGQEGETFSMKLANNPIVRGAFQTLATFDQMLKMFGSKDANGEGYLQNYFMRNWVDAVDGEQEWKERYRELMDGKAKEMLGNGKKFMDLYALADKGKKMVASYYDGTGMKEFELGQGQMMYLYAVDKMPMGRATNSAMGITEDVMERIEDALEPQLKSYVDWVQEELLPVMGIEIDKVHQRMFGAHMDAVDSYFPFVRYKDALEQTVVNGQQTAAENNNITSQTGAIKKRTASVAVWDLRKADFLDVLAEHVNTMSHWANFAELNRDLGTLLSYNHFKEQVMGMSSVYGSGKELWEQFQNVSAIATDCYNPEVSGADQFLTTVSKGVTMGKISFRHYTAVKQLLSLPAFAAEVDYITLSKDLARGTVPAIRWAWTNMPVFRKRVLSRTMGDYRLRETEYDSKIMKASSYGMLPNMAVDALTIALGSHAVYEKQKSKYLRWGMDEERAHRRAVQDAEMCFNKSQQSSEGAYLAPIQVDRTWESICAMLFRNSSTAYTRETHNCMRNLKHIFSGEVNKEFMAKKWLRTMYPELEANWTDEQWAKANKIAEAEIRKATIKNGVNLALFGWILPWLWRLGGLAPLLLLSGNDDEKKEARIKAARESIFAPVEGIYYGDLLGAFLNVVSGATEVSPYGLGRTSPFLGDLASLTEKALGGRGVEAANEIFNLLGGMGFGINPQTLTDWAVAIIDAFDDRDTQREVTLFITRMLQCPPSQLETIYFDELGMTGEEASKLTPEELCQQVPFEVPEGWAWCRLEDIAYVASGSTPSKDCFVPNGIPYIKMYNLRNQKIDFDYQPQYITEEVHNGKLARSRTEAGDLLMNIVGPPLGKLAIIPTSLPQANFNQAAVLIRPYAEKETLVSYLKAYLEEMSEINSIATRGSAGQVNISLTQSQNMRIPLPPDFITFGSLKKAGIDNQYYNHIIG